MPGLVSFLPLRQGSQQSAHSVPFTSEQVVGSASCTGVHTLEHQACLFEDVAHECGNKQVRIAETDDQHFNTVSGEDIN